MTGSFPPETALLNRTLTSLDLFRNEVYNSGDEGHWWFEYMGNLEQLFLGQTNFEYAGIPPVFGRLTNLIELDCSFALYYGPLDDETFEGLHKLGEFVEINCGFSFHVTLTCFLFRISRSERAQLQFTYTRINW